MPRVIGIDPGTVSIDVCGLDDGEVFLDRSLPTIEALAHPSVLVELIAAAAPLDLVAGPSGYGLPLTAAAYLILLRVAIPGLLTTLKHGTLKSVSHGVAVQDLP